MTAYLRAPRAGRLEPWPAVVTAGAVVAADALLVGGWLPRPTGILVAGIAILLLGAGGHYDLARQRRWTTTASAAASSVAIALIVGLTLSHELGLTLLAPETVADSAWGVPLVALWHLGTTGAYTRFVAPSARRPRAIVVGADAPSRDAAREFERRGYEVLGYVADGGYAVASDRPLLGAIGSLDELVETHAVDELIVGRSGAGGQDLRRVLTRGFARPIHVKYAPDFGVLRLPSRFDVSRIGHTQYVDFVTAASVSWTKRAMDLVVGSALLVVLIPVFALVAVAIKIDSRGPVFYRQLRVGKDRRLFRIVKFRSMRVDADTRLDGLRAANEASGPMFKIRNDPRATRVGRFLRRTSLDELPQLLNVLRGEMSLVGPRPPLASEVEQYRDWETGRLRAMPGMTGLWQVSGRTELPFEEMVRLDLQYVRNWSLGLDVSILIRTIPAVLGARGAY